jgi:hypothetical protein
MGRISSSDRFDRICIDCIITGDKTNRPTFGRIFLTKDRKVDRIFLYGLITNHEERNIQYTKPISIKSAKKIVKYNFQLTALMYFNKMVDIGAEGIVGQFQLKLIKKKYIRTYFE